MMNIQKELQQFSADEADMRFNNVDVAPETIRAIMINEVVPSSSEEDFYGKPDSAYMSTTIPLFRKAGIVVGSVQDILNNGIYITNAVKTPKSEYAVKREHRGQPALSGKRTCFVSKRQGYHAYG